ncbi:MAG: cofactor-independent phosphoglycerate mutase [Gemmataceae bacterium]
MKYAIVIPDGCADEPQETLGGRTPLQAAKLPNMDRVARLGVVGRSNNVPASLTPASDVATLSLFGYDPLQVYTGRSPLEAVAMGIRLGRRDWAVRCNFVTVENEQMRDFTAGHISSQEGLELIRTLNDKLDGVAPNDTTLYEFVPGVSYRNCLILRNVPEGMLSAETKTQPPHDIPDQPIADHLPRGPGGDFLNDLMRQSRELFQDHPVNRQRAAEGKKPATQIWLWGQGQAPSVRPFAEVYGKRGAIISAVDLVRGVGMLIGWKRIDVPGATGYLDTDYAAKGRHGVAALAEHDMVCVHVEAPDEASHEGKVEEKVRALERIDEHVVGPLLEALPKYSDWRILVEPDHRTTLRTRAHAHGAVAFAAAGNGILSRGQAGYDEVVAADSTVSFDPGHQLMRWFLG